MEIFNLCTKPSYKLGWLARIKWWFKRRKYIRQRAQRGFSSYDVWDFDAYLATVISGALEYLANHNEGHPHEYTDEEWKAKLLHISECFRQYNIEQEYPSYTLWSKACQTTKENSCVTIMGPDELLQAWRDEEKVNHETKMKKLKEGFDMLYEIYPNLWD